MLYASRVCVLLLVLSAGSLTAQTVGITYPFATLVDGVEQAKRSSRESNILLAGKMRSIFNEYLNCPENEADYPLLTVKLPYKCGSKGFHGLHFPFEPSVARLNFNRALPYRNTWMGGGYAGLDVDEFIGIRGFYFKAMNFGKIKIDEEKLTMYGLEFRLRLPVTHCLTPTIMVGSGYLNVNSNYKPRDVYAAKSQFFGQYGLGLTMPLSKNFQIQGGARAVILSDPSWNATGLHTSCMYNLGVRLTLSKKLRLPLVFFRN